MKLMKFLPLYIMSLLLVAGCASKECYDNSTTLPLAAFYGAGSHANLTLGHLTVYGVGAFNDSLIADSVTVQTVYFPFHPEANSSTYVLQYGSAQAGQSDTLSFYYTSKPWFASEACGVVTYFYVDSISYTRNLIDSVAVPGKLITNAPRTYIEIYLKEEENS